SSGVAPLRSGKAAGMSVRIPRSRETTGRGLPPSPIPVIAKMPGGISAEFEDSELGIRSTAPAIAKTGPESPLGPSRPESAACKLEAPELRPRPRQLPEFGAQVPSLLPRIQGFVQTLGRRPKGGNFHQESARRSQRGGGKHAAPGRREQARKECGSCGAENK